MYSHGVSEEVTGRWLREYGNLDELVIGTKVFFPMSNRPNMGGLSRKHIQQACEDSLRRLGVETIDLYQIHRLDPEYPDGRDAGRPGSARHPREGSVHRR